MESKDSDYESVYYPPWQYSPIFGPNPPTYGFNPQGWTPVNYRPPTAFKSHSTERLNCPRFVQPPVYSFRSPNPSPVHTPSGSPVMNRSIRFTPSPSPARNVRRMPPPPPLPVHPATSKPPLPRQRPPLLKAKTVDHPPDYLPPESCSHRSFDDLRKITNDGSIGHWNTPRMDMSSKIPSLDSLYEQLKAFAASPQTHPPPRVDALLAQLNVSARNPPKPEVEERLQRLEGDKDSLQMQVSILMDQIEVQTEKIADLEKNLSDRTSQLQRAEDVLQKEMLARSSAETAKLELLSEMSAMKLRSTALERENLELRAQLKRSEQDMVTLVSQCYSLCGASLGPQGLNRKELLETLQQNLRSSPAASSSPQRNAGTMGGEFPRRAMFSTPSGSSMADAGVTCSRPPVAPGYGPTSKTPPASVFRKVESDQVNQFNSLPRQSTNSLQGSVIGPSSTLGPSREATPTSLNNNKRAVVFAETERRHLQESAGGSVTEQEEAGDSFLLASNPSSPHSPSLNNISKQPRGFKKIFDKLKRTNSGALEGDPTCSPPNADDFRRGGVRATAGPRLGWNGHLAESTPVKTVKDLDTPFAQWTSDDVVCWLHEMGLHQYVSEAQRWATRGQVMLDCPAADLEKELGVKHALHKKKLILALEAKGRSQDQAAPMPILPEMLGSAGKLDHQWVVRWLDDIGLPQYKDAFLEARVDGRVLHMLTVDDLCTHLRVVNLLHVTCIRRGIQVLRLNDYNPQCLQRRSMPEDPAQPSPSQVALWTNHRVMEWLRAVDLSEYAPNMRGSGVHGALLVYEPRFNAELLATLLSIPQGKTLLRRHLATHFNQLLGRDIVQTKRETETSASYIPLNPVTKVKILKKSQFTLKRRKGKPDEFEAEDWICPNTPDLNDSSSYDKNSSFRGDPNKATDL